MAGSNDGSSSRRIFFQSALARMIGPVADYLERRLPEPSGSSRLRPPGAVEEASFADTCQRCGSCVEACPANAIFSLGDDAGVESGTPMIDPDRAACVVCDGLMCTHVCPSGALLPIFEPSAIRMGTAEVYAGLCVRTEGQACTLCVERCPIGDAAIGFPDDGPPVVDDSGCVGCGVCQLACPTTPKAIVVRPR